MADEFGTRDVLEQVDARLNNIEIDIREIRSGIEVRFDRMETSFGQVDTHFERVDARFDLAHQETNSLRSDMGKYVRWIVGLFFAGWLSLMATMASFWLKL